MSVNPDIFSAKSEPTILEISVQRKAEKNRKGKGGRKGRKGRGEKKGRGKGRQGRKGKDKGTGREKIPTSGLFELKSGHACTWMTMKTAQGLSQLQVTCQGLGASCLYEGKPEACRNYRRKAASYWAQAEAALKATPNPCHHNARLRPRVCRKGPTEAVMHFITPQDGNERVTAAVKGNVAKTDDDGDPKTQRSTSATQDGNSREAVMVGESDIPDPDEFAKKNCPERWQACL
uniref:Uncharacterized protein n=1 Tax=Eptatretus burgeri TaxID=7764 RepID=A0A8C4N294_EPTBU